MNYLIEYVSCMAATVFFALYLEQPKNTLFLSALISGFGYVVFILMGKEGMGAFFFSGLAVGVLCEITARLKKMTTTLYLVSGIIPLVPGLGLYRSMYFIAEKNYDMAGRTAVDALGGIGAIALAITLSAVIFSNIRFNRKKEENCHASTPVQR